MNKARVHYYKPIQIAEILYRDRVIGDIDLADLEDYRTRSRKWRDRISLEFLGRTCASSARYQDDLFNENAVPPEAVVELGTMNRLENGSIEAYIYQSFFSKYSQMSSALNYVREENFQNFKLDKFLNLFWREPGLKRSIDKIYEIVSYSLFSVLIEILEVEVEVGYNHQKNDLLIEFEEFAKKVISIDGSQRSYKRLAEINRVGVTNAADRGLDMWASFGPAIQIKHLTLDEKLAEEITSTVTAQKIVIVCKDSDESVIETILNQMGLSVRVQSIITEKELINWYDKAMNGKYSHEIGPKLIQRIKNEIIVEFPSASLDMTNKFLEEREYDKF
tara:strand:- start:75 stop:1076 length:1002 start_codon:yes stop_codon:yes gene_type:complete